MKIEVKIKETKAEKKANRRLVLESCRVFAEPGDGLRLANLAVFAERLFRGTARCLISSGKSPTVDRIVAACECLNDGVESRPSRPDAVRKALDNHPRKKDGAKVEK